VPYGWGGACGVLLAGCEARTRRWGCVVTGGGGTGRKLASHGLRGSLTFGLGCHGGGRSAVWRGPGRAWGHVGGCWGRLVGGLVGCSSRGTHGTQNGSYRDLHCKALFSLLLVVDIANPRANYMDRRRSCKPCCQYRFSAGRGQIRARGPLIFNRGGVAIVLPQPQTMWLHYLPTHREWCFPWPIVALLTHVGFAQLNQIRVGRWPLNIHRVPMKGPIRRHYVSMLSFVSRSIPCFSIISHIFSLFRLAHPRLVPEAYGLATGVPSRMSSSDLWNSFAEVEGGHCSVMISLFHCRPLTLIPGFLFRLVSCRGYGRVALFYLSRSFPFFPMPCLRERVRPEDRWTACLRRWHGRCWYWSGSHGALGEGPPLDLRANRIMQTDCCPNRACYSERIMSRNIAELTVLNRDYFAAVAEFKTWNRSTTKFLSRRVLLLHQSDKESMVEPCLFPQPSAGACTINKSNTPHYGSMICRMV